MTTACVVCGVPLEGRRRDTLTCSPRCRSRLRRLRSVPPTVTHKNANRHNRGESASARLALPAHEVVRTFDSDVLRVAALCRAAASGVTAPSISALLDMAADRLERLNRLVHSLDERQREVDERDEVVAFLTGKLMAAPSHRRRAGR